MSRDYEALRAADAADARRMAFANRGPLHHSTGTPHCSGEPCALCWHAARLAVQYLRPVIERRVVESIAAAYDVRCPGPHPGGD